MSTTAARVAEPPRSRRWIAQRLSQLDAERDYAEIVRLSTVYAASDFQMHWFYAVNSPAAGIAPGVTDAVYRGGSGTYTAKPNQRVADSADHLLTWFEHGPESPVTQASVEMVNEYHAHFARDYPQGFDKIEDYLYILCLNATAVNSSLVSLGLPGFDEKQKHAVHLFWSRLADQFRHVVAGGRVSEHAPFPDSYDGMVTVVDEYFARDWPVHEPGHRLATSAIEHFATTWFPRPLRFAGRALVTSFMAPAVLRAHCDHAAGAPGPLAGPPGDEGDDPARHARVAGLYGGRHRRPPEPRQQDAPPQPHRRRRAPRRRPQSRRAHRLPAPRPGGAGRPVVTRRVSGKSDAARYDLRGRVLSRRCSR